ncbi:Cse1-domain-containing protein [Athelia psychrophila]|uniref:Cse1-domain-containing protein n=1 Tax=Athelia psychrophila TaxID=1759441 RepID=A0A166QFP6_9AGAM|nr:Cse1-domain-containing protein [Fibularhizoctonia sp. CBS 109695]
MEQFEDGPLEFIRLDLALPGAGAPAAVTTRRQATADVLQALVRSRYEAEATEIVGKWIREGLAAYQGTKGKGGDAWKAEDNAVALLAVVAARGGTAQHGVTSTNSFVDVVKFFSDHVFSDLQAAAGTVEPILQVDAIRYLYTFRNQLTDDGMVVAHERAAALCAAAAGASSGLGHYVCHTYAPITIDRALFIKKGRPLLFMQADSHDIAPALPDAILSKIESAGSAERVAENDHLTTASDTSMSVLAVFPNISEGLPYISEV